MKTFLYIVSGIGTIIWALAFMLGFNYYIGGSMAVSIPVAVFLALVMGGLVYMMIQKSKGKEKASRNAEYLLTGVYAVVSVASCVFVNHYVDVETNKKETVKNEAVAQILELQTTFADDSTTPNSYNKWVAETLYTYGNGFTDESEKETKVAILEADLLDDDVENTRSEVNTAINGYYSSVADWYPFEVSGAISGLKMNKNSWEDRVHAKANSACAAYSISSFRLVSEHNDFGAFDALTTLGFGGVWAVLIIVVLQAMILMVYFAEKPRRASGSKRAKTPNVGSWENN